LHDKLKIKSANLSNDGTLTCEKIEFDNTSCIVENFDQLTLSEDNDLEATMNNYSGTVHFDKKLEIKSSGEFNNACKLLVDKEFKVVGDLGNEGYIEASEDLKIENGATVNVYSGSLISAKDFELNTSIVGTSTGYAKIEVEDDTELKSGSSLVGKIDLCDADGTIETNNATIGSDVTYCVNEVPATDCVPGNAVVIADQDSDGVPDTLDEYPADASRAFNSYYPNAVDDASIAFEDLWPAKGDYDFNDLVVDFSYQFVTNANNDYVDIIGTYEIKAVGATLDNGFGISFDIPPTAVASVTGITHTGSLIQNATNGLESGHANKSVIVVYDNIGSILGNMTNTSSGGTTTTYTPTVVTITLGTPQTSIGTEPFNPFIYINQIRGREVHLVNNLPTALADNSYFGQNDDATDSNSSYYKTINNYPWAIEVPTSFDYPVEKVDIVTAHTKFGPWAESSGASFTNWYENQPGFRNTNNIY